METTQEKLEELQAQTTIFEVPLGVKEIVDDFILITYDIPHSEEGDKARLEFLQEARRIGAVAHSESVYYMPWTQYANVAAMELAKVGKVFVWYTKASEDTAKELTVRYDLQVHNWMDEVDERLERINKHIDEGKTGLAGKMVERTVRMFKELEGIILNRKSTPLLQELATLKQDLKNTAAKLIDADYQKRR